MGIAFTAADVERIADLQPEGWNDIRPFFKFYVEQPFCHPIKLETGQDIAGIGCVTFNRDTAWLAHIIVSPRHRRQGLGRTITRRLIDIAEVNDLHTQILIATSMGKPLYEQLGFRESHRYVFYNPGRSEAVQRPNGVRPLASEDLEDLLDLDRRASGEDRRGMITCFCSRGWVVDAPGRAGLIGYYLPDLGDGAVIAETPDAGNELLRLRLSMNREKVVLPDANVVGLAFLERQGAELASTAARMVRNGEDPLDPTMLFQRVGGHFG